MSDVVDELEALIGSSRREEESERSIGSMDNPPQTGSVKIESILRIPVVMQVIVGSATMPVSSLMKLGRGAIVPLDHRIGEPVDVVVNGRLIARGEVVVVEDDNTRFGVSLTEIIEPGIPGRQQ
jgi:flagellar motor switch protein FliN/FliY